MRNDLLECFHATLKQMLRRMCKEIPKDGTKTSHRCYSTTRGSTGIFRDCAIWIIIRMQRQRSDGNAKTIWSEEEHDEQVRSTYQYVVKLRERLEEANKCRLNRKRIMKDVLGHVSLTSVIKYLCCYWLIEISIATVERSVEVIEVINKWNYKFDVIGLIA